MPRTHPPYAPEYRRRIIELAHAGRSIDHLAREFEPSANAIRNGSSRRHSMKVCAATA
jgi:transposase